MSEILCRGASVEASEGPWPRKPAVESSGGVIWGPGPRTHSSETHLFFFRSPKTTFQKTASFRSVRPSGTLTEPLFTLAATDVRGTVGASEHGWDATSWHFLPNLAHGTWMDVGERLKESGGGSPTVVWDLGNIRLPCVDAAGCPLTMPFSPT